jgi:hypothetical protein
VLLTTAMLTATTMTMTSTATIAVDDKEATAATTKTELALFGEGRAFAAPQTLKMCEQV